MARKGRRLSDAERAERRRTERERLEQATAELLTSEGWRRWLRARSVLHGYSLTNTFLIVQQCHARGIEPTYVAGFRAWLRLGRVVRKGQTGLRIWAKRIKIRDADGEEGEERKLRFRSATVFDVSQTEPLPGVEPAPLSPPGADGLGGESHADLLPALEQLATDSGYTLSWAEELPGAAKGRCDRRERTIEVLAGLPANDRVQVLIPWRKRRIPTFGMRRGTGCGRLGGPERCLEGERGSAQPIQRGDLGKQLARFLNTRRRGA